MFSRIRFICYVGYGAGDERTGSGAVNGGLSEVFEHSGVEADFAGLCYFKFRGRCFDADHGVVVHPESDLCEGLSGRGLGDDSEADPW